MPNSSPVILVHAQLPTVRPGGPDYLDPSTWVWVPCLEFPIKRVNELQFSPKPLKWIRYCIGAVTGSRGNLSRRQDAFDVIDYDQPLSSESQSIDLYYHISDAEKEQMFPTDPHLADPPRSDSVYSRRNTSTSSAPCRTRRDDLEDRDERCVATGFRAQVCDSAHLVPHCKGDDYIRELTTRRSRGREEDIVSSIDDVRNGILLHAGVHICLRRNVAFLPVPNFAMDASDAVPGADPSESMCLVHAFGPDYTDLLAGRRLAVPSPDRAWAAAHWPPAVLFEVVYGAAVMHEFGVRATFARVADAWDGLYYPHGGWAASTDAYFEGRHRARAERAAYYRANPPTPEYLDIMMMFPGSMLPMGQLRRMMKERRKEEREEARRRAEAKVGGWRRAVASAAKQ